MTGSTKIRTSILLGSGLVVGSLLFWRFCSSPSVSVEPQNPSAQTLEMSLKLRAALANYHFPSTSSNGSLRSQIKASEPSGESVEID